MPQPANGNAIAQQFPTQPTTIASDQLPASYKAAQITNHLNQGNIAFAQGKLDVAKQHYLAIRNFDRAHSIANHRLGHIADEQKDFANAERFYRTALIKQSGHPDILSDLGYSYLLQGKYAQSEEFLSQALAENPWHSKALNNLGLLHAKQGNAASAFATFRRGGTEQEALAKMAQLFPNRPDILATSAQSNAMLAGASSDAANGSITFQPMKTANPNVPIARSTPLPPTGTSANNARYAEIIQQMELEKARAFAVRNRQLNPGNPLPHNYATNRNQNLRPTGDATTRVPDSQLNSVLKAIEHQPQRNYGPNLIPNTTNGGAYPYAMPHQNTSPSDRVLYVSPPPAETTQPSSQNQMTYPPPTQPQLPAPDPSNPMNAMPTFQPGSQTQFQPQPAMPPQPNRPGMAQIWRGNSPSSTGTATYARRPTPSANDAVQHAGYTARNHAAAPATSTDNMTQAAARQGMNAGPNQFFRVPNEHGMAPTDANSPNSSGQPAQQNQVVRPGQSIPPGSDYLRYQQQWQAGGNLAQITTDEITQLDDEHRRQQFELNQIRQRLRAENDRN